MWVMSLTVKASVIYVSDFQTCISNLGFFAELQTCVPNGQLDTSSSSCPNKSHCLFCPPQWKYHQLRFVPPFYPSPLICMVCFSELTLYLYSLALPKLEPLLHFVWTILIAFCIVGLSLHTILHLAFRAKMSQHENLQLISIAYRIKFSPLSEPFKGWSFAL